jgi:type I restriction enzyme S subunit
MRLIETSFSDIFDFYNGKAIKVVEKGNVVVYGSNGIIGLTKTALYNDAIILGRVGAYCGSVMRCREGFWASDNTIVVRPKKEKADIDYCYYLLKNLRLNNYAGGAAQPLITQTILKRIVLKIPDLNSQQRIAEILSVYDDLIEINRKQIILLEEAATSLYKEWFINLRFPNYETAKIVDGVPKGWEKHRLIEFAEITMGQSPKSEFYNSKQQGLPFHQGVTNYGHRFVADITHSTNYTRIGPANSILFSVRAPVGRLNITKNKIVIGRGLAAINHKNGLQSFLFYLLKNRFYKDDLIGNGAIYASITKDTLYNQEFLLPDINLANQFNSIAQDMDQRIANADRQINLLKQARDYLLPRLVNGEIEV